MKTKIEANVKRFSPLLEGEDCKETIRELLGEMLVLFMAKRKEQAKESIVEREVLLWSLRGRHFVQICMLWEEINACEPFPKHVSPSHYSVRFFDER